MEKDQEKKPICKICGKSFPTGNALGGHMRSHLVKKTNKKPKLQINKLAFSEDDDDDNDDGYLLREYKNKYLKISTDENETRCKECGKGFPSVRSLCGHMRCHKIKFIEKNHACEKCGKEFDSMRALYGHMTHHSRKNKVLNESEYIQSDSEGKISSSYDSDSDEIEQAASILMMLSCGSSDSGLEESDGIRFVCNVDTLEKKKKKMNRRKKLGTWGSCNSFMFEEEKSDFDDLDTAFSDDDVENKFSKFEIKNKKRKIDENDENWGEIKIKGLKRRKPYICRICFKAFQTRKGLGGHKKAHKYDVFENKSEVNISMKQEDDDINNVDLRVKPWFIKGGHNHEPLLISSCIN